MARDHIARWAKSRDVHFWRIAAERTRLDFVFPAQRAEDLHSYYLVVTFPRASCAQGRGSVSLFVRHLRRQREAMTRTAPTA